jgi:hypothetical protein
VLTPPAALSSANQMVPSLGANAEYYAVCPGIFRLADQVTPASPSRPAIRRLTEITPVFLNRMAAGAHVPMLKSRCRQGTPQAPS